MFDHADELLRIGRAPDNDVVVSELSVSRYHAEIRRSGYRVAVVDLGSANGTKVNGVKIAGAHEITPPTEVMVGQARLMIRTEADTEGGVPNLVVARGDETAIVATIRMAPVAPPVLGLAPDSPPLSAREEEVIRCVAGGMTDKQIARQLGISEKTVHSHLERIAVKTSLRRRADLTRLALGLGLAAISPG